MLRIGKNPKEQEDHDNSSQKAEVPDYSTTRNYSSYQGTPAEAKPSAEGAAAASTRAMTESETLARDIKEGTLSGFVGSGTLIVGANGKVDANIEVAVAVIHGTINGDIIATQRLELGRAAKVNGNI